MSVSERSPSTSPFGEITPYDPTQVAGYARLVERLGETPSDNSADVLPTDIDTGEELEDSPMFDQLMAERAGTNETAPAESSVEASSSRLATLLRRGAEIADSSSERWDDTKAKAKTKLRGFGRVALRAKTATVELSVGASLLAANKGLELADRADDAMFRGVEAASTKVKDTYNGALDKSAEQAMKAGAKLENGMDIVGTKMINTKDAASEKLERTKASVHTTRAAGRAALEAFKATQRVHREQNQL